MDEAASRIARITPSGGLSSFYAVPPPESLPGEITVDASGNLWFTEHINQIVRVNPRLLTKAPPKSKKPAKKATERKR